MSMCRVISWVVGKGCLLWSACSLLVFALFPIVLQGQTCQLFQVSPDFLFLHSNPLWWKGYFFCVCVLVLKGVLSLHRTSQLQFLLHQWLGHRLGLLWCWMVCLGNELRSFCRFWGCTQVLHSYSSVGYDDYSISSKGFLPTVVDIMVIWIKFTHSHLL